jgi:hypothetical protein
MNDADFKRHLKDLAHGHHHPEEHDWSSTPGATAPRKTATSKAASSKPPTRRKTAKRK